MNWSLTHEPAGIVRTTRRCQPNLIALRESGVGEKTTGVAPSQTNFTQFLAAKPDAPKYGAGDRPTVFGLGLIVGGKR